MKRIFTLVVSLFVLFSYSNNLLAQLQTINFETAAGYTGSAFYTNTNKYWQRFNNVNEEAGSGTDDHDLTAPATGFEGSFYFAAEDLDGDNTILTDALNVIPYQALEVRILVGAPGTGYDAAADYLIIEYTYDGSNFIKVGQFSGGASNTFRVDTDMDGTGEGTQLTAAMAEFTFAIPKIGTSLQIRVRGNSSAAGEEYVFDNLRVYGVATTDATPPTLAITRNPVTLGSFTGTTDASISFNLAFSEIINNSTFSIADITINNPGGVTFTTPVVGDLTTSDNQNYTFTINGISAGNGDLSLTIGPNIKDLSDNDMAAPEGPSAAITIDNLLPSVSSSIPVVTGPVNNRIPRTGTITSTTGSPNVVGVGTLFTTELAVGAIIKDATGTTIGTVQTITDDLNLVLTANGATAVTGAAYTVGLFYTVTFNEPVTAASITAADFALTGGSGGTGTIGTVSPAVGSSNVFIVPVTITASGTLRLDKTNNAYIDLAGNSSTATFTSGTVATVDITAPGVTSIVPVTTPTNGNIPRTGTITSNTGSTTVTGTGTQFTTQLVPGSIIKDGSGTIIGTVQSITNDTGLELMANAAIALTGQPYTMGLYYTVTFNESVQSGSLSGADFTLTVTSSATGTVGSIFPTVGNSSTYIVNVSPTTGPGTLRLDKTSNSYLDVAGNSTTSTFTSGSTATIDLAAPSVSSIVPVVTAANNGKIARTGTITANTGSPNVTGSGTTFTTQLAVGSIIYDCTGTLIGTVQSISSNTALVLTANAAVAVTGGSYKVGLFYTLTFSEPVTSASVSSADFTLSGTGSGTLGTISPTVGNSTVYIVNVTPTGDGTLELEVTNNGYTDASNNTSTSPFNSGTATTIDITPPAISGDVTFSDGGGAAETLTMTFTETINLLNNAQVLLGTPGFSVSANPNATFGPAAQNRYTTAGNLVTLTSAANGGWTQATQVTYTSGGCGNIITDAAGNEMATVTKATTDLVPPALITGMVFFPNGSSPETIVFQVSEELDLLEGANVIGFSSSSIGAVGVEGTGTAIYSSKGVNNIITLTSAADGQWTDAELISYTQSGTSNVIDISINDNELVNIVNEAIQLRLVNITSNNANPLLANASNNISVTFTATRPLLATPTGTIGGVAAVVTGTNPYTATVSAASVLDGLVSFSLVGLETGKSTTITAVTNTSSVTVDKLAPATPVIPDLDASDDTNINTDNVTSVTTGLTFSGLAGSVEANSTVRLYNNTTLLGSTTASAGGSWTITINLVEGTYPQINVTATDAAGNESLKSPFLNLVIDTTPPSVQSFTIIPPPTPNIWSTTNGTSASTVTFRLTFNEDVTGIAYSGGNNNFQVQTTGSVSANNPTGAANTTSNFVDITETGISGQGRMRYDFIDNDNIIDLAGNPVGGSGIGNGNFLTTYAGSQYYSIVLPEPSNEAFTVTESNITGNSITLSWNSTNTAQIPTHFLVLASTTAANSFPSVDDGVPVGNGPLAQNVARVAGTNSWTFTGLSSGTSYDFRVYKYTLSPNNTSDNIDFETTTPGIRNGVSTITASVSSVALNSVPVPISSLKNTAGNSVSVMQFTIRDDGQDPIVPNVMSLQLNGVSQETVTFTLREELTLAEGASVTGFSSSTGTVASAIYTGKGTTNTITLRSGANGTWTGATTISYSGTGNAEFVTLGKMQAINAHAVAVGTDVVQTFNTNGNFIVPAGVTSIQVEAWGAGGSGGGYSQQIPYNNASSYGGGGGAYSRSLLSVTPGANINLTVGVGGPAVPSTANCCDFGVNGGTTSFGPNLVVAEGGFGGLSSAYPVCCGYGYMTGTFGLGGRSTSGIGDIKFSGGTGGFGSNISPNPGGGGGSSAGTNANGNNGANSFPSPTTCGGCSIGGGGAPVGGGSGGFGAQSFAGGGGGFPGGGGGGVGSINNSGAGANGQIRITYSAPSLTGTSDWDGDNAPFKFSKLVITQGDANAAALANWTDVIAGAELFDGTNTFPATSINSSDITFDGIPSTSNGDFGFIPDATATHSSKTYTLRIWIRDDLNNTLAGSIDGLNLDFEVDPSIPANLVYDDVSNSNQKSSRLVSTHPAIQAGANPVEVVATQLDFSTSPNPAQLVLTNVTSTSVAPDFLTRPRIRARDANGNTDLNYTASITLTNAGTITMNPNPVSMVNGLATFPVGFQYQDAGDGTLTATTSTVAANSLVPAPGNSTPVTVSYSNLTTLQPGTLITPPTFSSLNTGGFVQVFDFRVVEDNGSGGDGSPTRISQIVYTQGTGNDIADWSQAISQAALWDGANPFITGTIGANSITFSGLNTAGLGFVGDNATKNYQLYITLKPNLGGTLPDDIDNKNFVFEVLDDNILLATQSSLFTGSEAINSGAPNIAVNVVATKLQFDTHPAAVLLVGKDISLQPPVPVVEALDVNNNRDLNYNSATVTVTNSLGLTMTNSPGNASIVNGLLTFPNDFRFNTTGTGATLTVASTGPSVVSNATSTAFDVRGGVATTITAGALTEPLTISSLVDLTHTPAGLAVFDFNINDDPGGTPANEDDGNPTQLTSIFITSGAGNTITDWSQAIETATLSDGTNTVTVTTIDPSNYLYFDLSSATGQLLGLIADDATKNYVLTLWLKTALGGTLPTTIDGLRFVFDVQKANIALGPNSTNFLGTPQTQNSGAGNNLVTVIASELHFTTPAVSPAVASLNSNFAATVQARDVNNNRDLDFTGGGSTITALTNATNATMSSTPPVVGSTFTAGVFNFPGDFQFISGNNNDDVTLSMIAGGINSVAFPAPFTPQIILQSSFESLLVVDPGFTPTLDLPYKDYQNIAAAATSIALAQFKLSDGNGVTPDSDGASTNIETLELSITNPDNIRSLGLYLGTSLIQSKNNADFVTAGNTTVTFTGLSGAMIAPDNGSLIITVRASFYDTDANITDNEVIQLQVVDVTQNGGSQFNIIGTAPLIGGITGGAITDGNVKIEVTATRLDFTVQPVPFEGIQRPLASTPQVRARDVNAIVDLDHSFVGNLTTPGAGLTTTAFNFTNGIVDFTGLQYVSPGDGTITITSNGLSSASGGSIICNHVDVINVFSTYASSGVITSPNLPGGAINRVIFGVTFNTPYSVTGEPKLNSFIINFSNPISGIFTNIRVFESTNTAFDVTDANIVTTPSIGGQLTAGSNFLTVDFTGGTPRDLSLPANTQLTYFLMVDVSPTASGSTPKIQPSVVNDDTNIIISNGSVYSTQNTVGQEYTFASIFPPTLVSSYPATGQLNVDKNQPTVDLVFSVPVWSLDQKILLYDQSTGLLVQELAAVNGQYPGTANLAGTVANPLKFSLPPLLDDRVYYITIAQGDFENNIGIVDESLNEFPGFTYSGTLYFKTANPNPPILLNNNSVPVANNPTITSVTLTGATINATFDQQGTAYFLVVNQGDPAPTNAEIKGTSTYVGGTVIDRGVFAINQVNPISQFGQITAALTPSTTYNVWMYAANNALPTPIETSAPYGSIASNFAVGGAGPTLTFTSPASAQPSGPVLPIPQINVCRNSFQTLNLPLQIVEGNTGDFAGGGTQVFNLLLPSGFQFDVATTNGLPTGPPVHGTLTLTGGDFTGTGTLTFINNTTLRVSFQNSGNTSRDNITISGLRILTTAITSGNIVRLGGNAIPTAFPDLTPIATISSFDAPTVDFTNEYTLVAFPNSSTPITILPDDQGQVELIPLPAAGDYGPNAFSGSGVNINQLNVTAVTKDAPFNITLTHTDNNGCISQNPIQYTVYDSKAAIKGLSSTFCIDNVNFPADATLATPALTQTVLFTNLGAHFMDTLKANVPFNVDPTQIINGPDWISILKTLPVAYDSVQDPNDPLRYYRSYRIDGAKILNANTLSGGTIPNPYSHFINTTLQGNTYYDGGSLGLVEFTGQYQNQANQSVYIPLRQNVEFFVPAVPIVEVGLSNQSALDAGVPIFCEQGGNIVINGFPAASVGSSVGFFSLENNGTIIHARDLTVAITAQSDNGGNFQITLSKPANLLVGNSIQIFGVTGTLPFSSTHTITSKINDSVYVINRVFNAGSALNAAKVTISLTGFTDNSNGTAELDPTLFDNSYGDLRVNYTYKSNDSPCESTGGLTIRIEPNPVALFTYGSAITPNTPLSSAICEGIPVDFNGSTSTIAQGSINTYSWNFSDATNETAANPNTITAAAAIASHIYIQSAPYTPSLIVTSTFGCSSVAQSVPLNVGIIPVVGFAFEGVSTATPLSFTNTTAIPAGSVGDGLGSLTWDYDDGNSATVTSNFTAPVTNDYANPGRYDVSLEVTSLLGCTNELAQKVIVVPQFTPTDLVAYEEGFETDGGGWQPDELDDTPATWADGTPSKTEITLAPNNGQRIWVTGLTAPYGVDERSALYSPSFDLSQLDRPMISLNTFRQLAAGEGVVLEFSIDNKNVADPTKQWTVLGKLINQQITGVGWYNGIGLSSQPGNQTTGFGWTGERDSWVDSKHVLDTVLLQPQVVFRFALATQTSTPTLDGFAIDNVRVGNRTRTILVENFKNSGRSASEERDESNYLKNFKNGAVGTKLVKINYHVGFPQADPFNLDNPADPSSRALYYNIESTPLARLDGKHAPGQASEPFSDWGEAYYDEQTLKLANAKITPTPVVNLDGSISIDVNVESISIDLPANTILHVAVVEKLVTALPSAKSDLIKSGESTFEFVLKKLLPSAAGTRFGQPLVAGNSRTFTGFTWTPEPSRMYPNTDDLAVIAFVQDEVTKEVYQAEIVDVGTDPPVVTGLGDILATSIEVYPNPANKEFVIKLPAPTMQSITIDLIDQVGKTVHGASFSIGEREQTLNIEEQAAGIYILQLRDSKGALIRRKLMITH